MLAWVLEQISTPTHLQHQLSLLTTFMALKLREIKSSAHLEDTRITPTKIKLDKVASKIEMKEVNISIKGLYLKRGHLVTYKNHLKIYLEFNPQGPKLTLISTNTIKANINTKNLELWMERIAQNSRLETLCPPSRFE